MNIQFNEGTSFRRWDVLASNDGCQHTVIRIKNGQATIFPYRGRSRIAFWWFRIKVYTRLHDLIQWVKYEYRKLIWKIRDWAEWAGNAAIVLWEEVKIWWYILFDGGEK